MEATKVSFSVNAFTAKLQKASLLWLEGFREACCLHRVFLLCFRVMIGIGEQVYSILLLTVFFIEIFATGFIPYLGKAINFLLLSWIYAYYCFEYKWNHSEIDLDRRLNLFESNWAFFAGFGSPCVLPVLFFSPLVTYGFVAILFPLFVLRATDSEVESVLSSERTKWGDGDLGRLPIFYAADTLSLRILSLSPFEPQPQQKAL